MHRFFGEAGVVKRDFIEFACEGIIVKVVGERAAPLVVFVAFIIGDNVLAGGVGGGVDSFVFFAAVLFVLHRFVRVIVAVQAAVGVAV